MRGKRALLTVTAGASAQACAPDGRDGDMRLMLWPIMHALHYIGFSVLEPFTVYGVRGGLAGEAAGAERCFGAGDAGVSGRLKRSCRGRRCRSTAMTILTPIWR